MQVLYEILVPTVFGDSLKKIPKRYHKKWDRKMQKITGGMTIMAPSRGKWIFEGAEYAEKIIPVRMMVEEKWIKKIVKFTINHYRQHAVMYYLISKEVRIQHRKPQKKH